MPLADLFIEPDEQLWAALPALLLVMIVLDVVWLRPIRGDAPTPLGRRRAGIIGILLGLGLLLLWTHPGLSAKARWWYPTWTIILFWVVAAREGALRSGTRSKTSPWLIVPTCAMGAGLTLVLFARGSWWMSPGVLICSVIGIMLLAALWSLRGYRPRTPDDSGRRILAPALRILALMVLAILLVNPIIRTKQVRYEKARLLVLLDDSRSMSIRDVMPSIHSQAVSRATALNTTLTTHTYEFDRIGRELDWVSYRFSTQLTRDKQLSIRPNGKATALGDAIQQAYEDSLAEGRPVGGILLFTDGASNLAGRAEPAAAAAALAAGHVPLWIVGVGNETPSGQTRSIEARNLFMAGRIAVMNQLPVTAEFGFIGMQGEPSRIELLFDDEVVDRQRAECTRSHEARQFRFTFTPSVGGLHKVTVRAVPERFRTEGPPAQMSQYLHVTDDAIRVLYIEGRPRYEGAFLARALAAAGEHIRFHKTVLAAPADENLPRSPGGPAGQWQWYHAIILGDMTISEISHEQMKQLRRQVGDAGCGLAILGGKSLMANPALNGTPLAELLPVAPGADWIEQEVIVKPTPAGLSNPIVQIAEPGGDLSTVWMSLPPMRGACRFTSPKPAAQIVATGPNDQPMIVTQTYGAGRVALFAFDSTWQWCMKRDDGLRYHRTFWRQVVLWLANRKPAVWISSQRPRYQLPLILGGQQRVEVQAGLDSPISGQTITDARLDVQMVLPSGQSIPLTMAPDGDHFTTMVSPQTDGIYTLRLAARTADREIGKAEGQFVVDSPDIEMSRPLADFDLLRDMAAKTHPAGGKFVTLDQVSRLLKEIGSNDYRRRIEETQVHDLAHEGRWRIWTIFCGLLLAEWVVRKRRGLV